MKALESSIARLVLAAVTVAAALATMEGQSEFGLGVTATLVAVWYLGGLGEVGLRRGRGLPIWAAFLIAAAGSLAWSSGSWSEASIRGAMPAVLAGELRARQGGRHPGLSVKPLGRTASKEGPGVESPGVLLSERQAARLVGRQHGRLLGQRVPIGRAFVVPIGVL
jgi:hypothetical protein